MLDSLYIKNYRNLGELKIDSLSRVNLITGKNNTGKSTLLEAIALYAAKGDVGLIYQLLEERGENYKTGGANINLIDVNLKIFSSLFTDRHVGFDAADAILIGNAQNTLPEKRLSLEFARYMEDPTGNYRLGLKIKTVGATFLLPFDEDRPHRLGFRPIENNGTLRFIRTGNIDKGINGHLFDRITLTDKEKYVIEALQIIEPRTERIAFVEETLNGRNAVIKLSDSPQIRPLKSMGDGMNRILTIILALVNADQGFLLVDEFENGLHHSVQERLWKIIFKLAPRLHAQVFVTTHSDDCIKGFEAVLNGLEDPSEGTLIRLDNENGKIKPVAFDAKELHVANDQHIEIR